MGGRDCPGASVQLQFKLRPIDAGWNRATRRSPGEEGAALAGQTQDLGYRGRDAAAGSARGHVDGSDEQLRQPSGVEVDAARRSLVREVGGKDDRQTQVATGKGQRQVPSQIARVTDHQYGVGPGVRQVAPEGPLSSRAVVEGERAGQVHQVGVAVREVHQTPLGGDGRPGRVDRFREPSGGEAEERGLANVRPADERNDGQVGALLGRCL